MNATEYLDAAKRAAGLESDYELAKMLGTTTGCISNYRKGRSLPDSYTMTRLAEIIGTDPLEAIAAAEIERARTDEQRRHWKKFLHRAAVVFVVIALNGMLFSAVPVLAENIHYAQLIVLAWFLTRGVFRVENPSKDNINAERSVSAALDGLRLVATTGR